MDKPKTTPVIHERPKMPRATWDALRNHIVMERKRKQEEEEKSEEYERQKKEREYRKKQEATSLEQTKDQISELERKLTKLKEEKHQLFLTLKKVLNEDETRRRKETDEMNVLYGTPHNSATTVLPPGGHTPHNHHIFMNPQSHSRQQQSPYMKSYIAGGASLPAAAAAPSVKRQRTPSPPPTARPLNVNAAYYRSAPPLSSHLRIPVSSVYGHPSVASPTAGATSHAISAAPGGGGGSANSGNYPFSVTQVSREEERKQVYLSQPSRFIQQIEAAGQKPPSAFPPQDRDRSRLGVGSVGGGVSSHSQAAVALSASRAAGSITSGFPLRSSAGSVGAGGNSLMNTVAPSHPSRLAYNSQAAAQIAASQVQQNNSRYFPGGIREH